MMYLTDPVLGRLDLGPYLAENAADDDCGPEGYVVAGWTLGFPTVRVVARNRALADGTVDDTRYVGARVITVNLRLDQNRIDPQLAVDALMPYVSPRNRPRLHWVVPGSTQKRSAVVRGADAPFAIAGPRAHTLVVQWVAPGGLLESSDESCEIINPSSDTESGRTYDLTFDRVYPFSLGVGDRLIVNEGNAVADWRATIFGAATDPALIINGVPIRFDRVGGLDLTGGTSLVIDSKERTILLNGDPEQSRYDKVNFTEWSWESVRLQPGENIVRFEGNPLSEQASVQFCWRSAWL